MRSIRRNFQERSDRMIYILRFLSDATSCSLQFALEWKMEQLFSRFRSREYTEPFMFLISFHPNETSNIRLERSVLSYPDFSYKNNQRRFQSREHPAYVRAMQPWKIRSRNNQVMTKRRKVSLTLSKFQRVISSRKDKSVYVNRTSPRDLFVAPRHNGTFSSPQVSRAGRRCTRAFRSVSGNSCQAARSFRGELKWDPVAEEGNVPRETRWPWYTSSSAGFVPLSRPVPFRHGTAPEIALSCSDMPTWPNIRPSSQKIPWRICVLIRDRDVAKETQNLCENCLKEREEGKETGKPRLANVWWIIFRVHLERKKETASKNYGIARDE